MSASRAYEFGMVNKVVPRDQLREATAAWASKLAGPEPAGQLAEQAGDQPRRGTARQARGDGRGVPHAPLRPRPERPDVTGNSIGGVSGKSAASANKSQDGKA
jgi:enoyl-CoA hydratase